MHSKVIYRFLLSSSSSTKHTFLRTCHCVNYIGNYRLGGVSRYIYRDKLIRMHRRLQRQFDQYDNDDEDENNDDDDDDDDDGQYTLDNGDLKRVSDKLLQKERCLINNNAKIEIDMSHIGEYDPTLLGYVLNFPSKTIPCFESGTVDALRSILYETNTKSNNRRQLSNTNSQRSGGDETMNDNDAGGAGGTNTTDGAAAGGTDTNATVLDDTAIDQDALLLLRGLEIQVLLKGNMKPTALRSIKSEHMNKLVRCPGIVISNSPVKTRAVKLAVRCPKCNDTRTVMGDVDGAIRLPRVCANSSNNNQDQQCGPYPFIVVPDESIFIDQQTLKLQEAPERVPTGEMPRSVVLAVERSLVDIAPPGTRISILCIPTLFNVNTTVTTSNGGTNKRRKANNGSSGQGASHKSVYLRVVGFQKENDAHGEGVTFTPNEEVAFISLSKRPDVYDILYRSIAPNIQGNYTIDIKKALLCQLLSGSRKRLLDGVKLRGDINILLLGDPSMAKSQFLKFISKVAPVGIYTSGKGSSAAGLTASVIKDQRGEFYLEGGAMVLADGGIVCIDEFDKMRPADRVAIHEAMEQQTISVAKAGITTVLNSRSSVLAAANPVYGRYDDFKSASDNIDLMTTILSRFDMIFLVRDIREEERDRLICQHVMGVHISSSSKNQYTSTSRLLGHHTSTSGKGGDDLSFLSASGTSQNNTFNNTNDDDMMNDIGGSGDNMMNASPEAIAENVMKVVATGQGELEVASLKKYIQYCKAKCSPRLSLEAGEYLTSSYVKIRDDIRKYGTTSASDQQYTSVGSSTSVIPITVRQLEAMVRISESLAKLRIDSLVQTQDVDEAIRLFTVSTMAASSIDTPNQQTATTTTAGNSTIPGQPGGGTSNIEQRDEVDRAESYLRNRLTIGNLYNKVKLIEEGTGQGFTSMTIAKLLYIMTSRGEIIERNQGRLIKRIK
jgi:DNA replicative helicase MCM subunit Mcm2 (Cdc46/Mcm family)